MEFGFMLYIFRWHDAESDATKALKLHPDNLIGLLRRGVARTELRQWNQARQGKNAINFFDTDLTVHASDIQAFLECGGSPTEGLSVLDAITNFELVLKPGPIGTSDSDISEAFANLHLDNDSPFAVRDSGSVPDGKGAFATREFKRGDLILSERPLVSISTRTEAPGRVEAALCKLSPENLARFLSLYNAHTSCNCHHSVAMGIFSTNAFALEDDTSGVCFHASRFNHSCASNARHSFDPITGDFRIYALGPISVGEEIFVMYSSGRRMYGTPRAIRQADLRMRYHFTCACTVCALPAAESKASDARRVRLTALWERIPDFAPTQVAERLSVIVEGVRTLKEEGFLADADDFTIDAGCVCAYHSDLASARYWAGVLRNVSDASRRIWGG